MYRHNNIGPWPQLDLDHPKTIVTSGVVDVTTTTGAEALRAYATTYNQGSSSVAFDRILDLAGDGLATFEHRTYGVFLEPLSNIDSDKNIMLDISIVADMIKADVEGDDVLLIPVIGFNDNTSVGTAFHANNSITNWFKIPSSGQRDSNISINTQVIITDIITGSISDDKPLFIGVMLYNQTTATITPVFDLQISARYATASIKTVDKDG